MLRDFWTARLMATLLLSGIFANQTHAGSDVQVGRTWPAADRVSMDKIDHATFDSLLKKYVDDRGRVDYTKWKVSAADAAKLERYLSDLSRADAGLRADRKATLAFWINAYNAVTIHGILREYPTTSIRNHTAKVFGYNIWDDLLLAVGDRSYSLNQMEHEVLRKMSEPRIHFAIVCASISCPKLLNEAYVASKLDEQLSDNARDFFADLDKFTYDARAERISVSPILKWFAADFGATTAAQMATIAPYLPTAEAQQLTKSGRASVSYLDYDWGLNDKK